MGAVRCHGRRGSPIRAGRYCRRVGTTRHNLVGHTAAKSVARRDPVLCDGAALRPLVRLLRPRLGVGARPRRRAVDDFTLAVDSDGTAGI